MTVAQVYTPEVEQVEVADTSALDAMRAGFEGKDVAPEPTATEQETTPEEQSVAAESAAEEPKVTEAELKSAFEKQIAEMKAEYQTRFDKVFGRMGAVQDTLNQLQQKSQVVMTPDKLNRLRGEFPELAELLAQDLSEMQLAGNSGVDEATLRESFAQQQKEMIAAEREQFKKEMEIRLLTRQHRDWKEVASFESLPDGSVKWNNEAFGKWVASQPQDVQQTLLNSTDADFLSDKLTEFKEATAPKQTKSEPKKRLEMALTPKGVPGTAQPKSALEEMREGFINA